MTVNRPQIAFVGTVVAAASLVLAACASNAPGGASVGQTVFQAPLPPAAPLVTTAAAGGWDTPWSQRLGIQLLASFDSSGPPAWDPARHPLVYIGTNGPGYGGLLSETNKLPGFAIIDASTREVVAAPSYTLGAEAHFEPHGIGASPDGRWIYLPTGMGQGFVDENVGRLLIINAQTLKLDKVLSTPGNPHHIRAFRTAEGKDLVQVEDFGDSRVYALDPDDDHRVVGGIGPADLRGNGYLGFPDPSGKYVLISVRTGFDSEGGVAVVDVKSWTVLARINTRDASPIWVTYSADGKYAYVSGGHENTVAKIKMEGAPPLWKVEATARAGTEGPYGLVLSWDEKQLWAVGKGEGSHNRGITLGLVDPQRMGRPLDTFYTGCKRADHAVLHPNPDRNEMWISCNASFETVVFNMGDMAVSARIPMPNGGSTHGGAFIRYDADFTGEVLSDTGGLHGAARQEKLALMGGLQAASR